MASGAVVFSYPCDMQQAIEAWRSRTCPQCGVQPGDVCVRSTGKLATSPHRSRWPEGVEALRERQRELRAQARQAHQRRERLGRPPLSIALEQREQNVMAEYRERLERRSREERAEARALRA